jgi:DNA (cytosine-5)-methyltransferase 1
VTTVGVFVSIPVIDLFAGPGGLGEGFAAATTRNRPAFHLKLSVECDPFAHQTLTLRAFCREFTSAGKRLPGAYARHLRGELSRAELFAAHPREAAAAFHEACLARMGDPAGDSTIDGCLSLLRKQGVDFRKGVMIGGPPCQAYSLVGRSRMSRARASGEYREQDDGRHVLYRQYLRLIEDLTPAVFVMENVRGILSSQYEGRPIFGQILDDLSGAGYDLHALGARSSEELFGTEVDPRNYLLTASDHGVPQRRARVFVIGTRKDLHVRTLALTAPRAGNAAKCVKDAIGDLPALRSGLSTDDSADEWKRCVRKAADRLSTELSRSMSDVAGVLARIASADSRLPSDRSATMGSSKAVIVNHETRGHIAEDLERYLFYAAWGAIRKCSPTLFDLPKRILPDHQNVRDAQRAGSLDDVAFADRFRVQLAHEPSTTITSHISKDGHYFIHPDPRQCRSLTVREAARLQTFPDNYLFCGPRTEQYKQVGNAVPPMLARQIAQAIQALDIW